MPITRRFVDSGLLGTAFACLVMAIMLYLGAGYHAGFLTINQRCIPVPAVWWQLITFLGDEFLLLSLLLLLNRRCSECLRVIFWAVLSGFLITRAIKYGFMGIRPPLVLPIGTFRLIGVALKKSSFPSGHTELAFAVAGSLLVFVTSQWKKFVLLICAGLVGLSRVAVGVHWPIDVLVGAAIGLVAARLGVEIAEIVSKHQWFNELPVIILILLVFPLCLIMGYDPGLEVPAVLSPLVGMLVLTKFVQDDLQAMPIFDQ